MPFKIGDVVRLKSGDQAMTVVGVAGDNVEVAWTVAGKSMTATYPSAALVEYGDDFGPILI